MSVQIGVGRTYRNELREKVRIESFALGDPFPYKDSDGLGYRQDGVFEDDYDGWDLVEEVEPVEVVEGKRYRLRNGEEVDIVGYYGAMALFRGDFVKGGGTGGYWYGSGNRYFCNPDWCNSDDHDIVEEVEEGPEEAKPTKPAALSQVSEAKAERTPVSVEVGKCYRLRNGDEVFVLRKDDDGWYPITVSNGELYTEDGKLYHEGSIFYGESDYDIVEEVEEEEKAVSDEEMTDAMADIIFKRAFSNAVKILAGFPEIKEHSTIVEVDRTFIPEDMNGWVDLGSFDTTVDIGNYGWARGEPETAFLDKATAALFEDGPGKEILKYEDVVATIEKYDGPLQKAHELCSKWPGRIERAGYPDNNPKTLIGAKKVPLHLVPPSAKFYLAQALEDGAKKYGPYNWRDKTISVSVYKAACERHLDAFWDGEENAADSGVHHLAHAMACLALMLDARSIGKLNDDRPTRGAAPRLFEEYVNSKEVTDQHRD